MPPPEIVILRKPTVRERGEEHLEHAESLIVAALRELTAARKCLARILKDQS